MLSIARSYFASLKASAALGRASRLRAQGRNAEALAEARRGLSLLSALYIFRVSPPEGAALLTLTMLVEQLSFEAKEPGASHDDLRDSLAFLRLIAKHPTPNVSEQLAWVPYLESCLAQHN